VTVRVSLRTVSEIASEVIRTQNDRLEVVGVSPGEGDGAYTEIMIVVNGCRKDPCSISLGVLRDVSEDDLRLTIAKKLQEHLASGH
jgi:hypothetical protein